MVRVDSARTSILITAVENDAVSLSLFKEHNRRRELWVKLSVT